jgi:hypothetical protein
MFVPTTSYVGKPSEAVGVRSPRTGNGRCVMQRDPGGFRGQGNALDHNKRKVRSGGPDRPQNEMQIQAEDPNIIYGIARRPDGSSREGSSRLAPPPRRRGGSRHRL